MSEVLSLAQDRDVAIERAARALRDGGMVVFPTDTVYGVGADAFQPFATNMLFHLKGRPRSLPLPVMVSAPRQAWALTSHVPREAGELAAAFWPGALTLVLQQAPDLTWDLGETKGSVALRVPANDVARELFSIVGPMAVTSANRTGEPTPRRAADVADRLGELVSVYLDGGEAPGDVPSTIVDLTGRRPRIRREGTISREDIERIVGARVAPA
ncbi:MAG: L-threonylcarbamoyladenylate synthase [Actinomycetota bacterium]|nr:threonylcarbamoyl-AMP synthase [Actinomycetota bacterium]